MLKASSDIRLESTHLLYVHLATIAVFTDIRTLIVAISRFVSHIRTNFTNVHRYSLHFFEYLDLIRTVSSVPPRTSSKGSIKHFLTRGKSLLVLRVVADRALEKLLRSCLVLKTSSSLLTHRLLNLSSSSYYLVLVTSPTMASSTSVAVLLITSRLAVRPLCTHSFKSILNADLLSCLDG